MARRKVARCPICNGRDTRENPVSRQIEVIEGHYKSAYYAFDAHTRCADATFLFGQGKTEYRRPTSIKLLRGPWIKRRLSKALKVFQR